MAVVRPIDFDALHCRLEVGRGAVHKRRGRHGRHNGRVGLDHARNGRLFGADQQRVACAMRPEVSEQIEWC